MTRALALLVAVLPALAAAQDRPSEEDLFGKPQEPAPAPPARTEPPDGREGVEAELFGSSASPASQPPPQGVVSAEQDDPLRLGGQLYLRTFVIGYEGQAVGDWPFSSPNLLDLFLDARPNDRVRAFVLGRMFYDPTGGTGVGQLFGSATGSNEPTATLDQLWMNFDLGRTVFVTAGKQHVKWGVGKFWNPTDYLHPVRRNPLAVFDQRSGVTMVRAHLPWEKYGWNFHAVALLEDAAGDPEGVDTLGRIGLAARAELVLGSAELGLDALLQDGSRPRFGVDLSGPIWDLDVYGELAIRTDTDRTRWRPAAAPPSPVLGDQYEQVTEPGFEPQLVLGGSWTGKYSDEDTVTVGAEYFWNGFGYDDPTIYPFLVLGAPDAAGVQRDPRAFSPYYTGQHYASLFASLPAPGSWNDTVFTLSLLGNLSDRSFVARLDHSVLALTYLRVETFVSVAGGTKGGEFRLEVPPQLVIGGSFPVVFPTETIPANTVSFGVALRLAL